MSIRPGSRQAISQLDRQDMRKARVRDLIWARWGHVLYFKAQGWSISSRRSNMTRKQSSGLGLSPGALQNLKLRAQSEEEGD